MNKKLFKRILLVAVGQIVIGLGVGIFVFANLGIDPLGVFHSGMSKLINQSYGTTLFLESLVTIVIILFIDKKYINIATVMSMFITGFAIDFFTTGLHAIFPNELSFAVRLIMILIACVIISVGLNIYVLPDLGVGAIDAIAELISDKGNFEYQKVKVSSDLIFLAVGLVLGGTFGIGTIISAIIVGPIIQATRKVMVDPINNFIEA